MPSRSKYWTNASEPRQDSSGNRVPSTNRGCSSDASGRSGRAPIPSCMWNASTSRHRCKSSARRGSTAASRCPQRRRLAARPSRVGRHKSSRRKERVTDENNCCPQAVRRGAVLVGFARAERVCWRPVPLLAWFSAGAGCGWSASAFRIMAATTFSGTPRSIQVNDRLGVELGDDGLASTPAKASPPTPRLAISITPATSGPSRWSRR